MYKTAQTKQTYLQTQLIKVMPILMEKIKKTEQGRFLFVHEKFPELQIEAITSTQVAEQLEHALRRKFKKQPDKYVDYLLNLLCN
ncbi:hypothetical protein KBC04_01980 [Candidatus Babeliales bacterium]|nr:hypothetical protein [Candidatus Babeliales bacterium]MBP9843822.1 hypothetical protein [Candidatus Babeliales bacterium]